MTTMELVKLTTETLSRLDRGKYKATLEQAFQRAVQDCIDRPGDDRNRQVTVQFDLAPTVEVEDNVMYCDGVKARYQVRAKLPNWESKVLDFGVRKDGSLVFNEASPDNHRQMALPMDEAE